MATKPATPTPTNDDPETVRPPDGVRVLEVRKRSEAVSDAPSDQPAHNIASGVRRKDPRAAAEETEVPEESPALSSVALRPARLPADVDALLSVPPTPDAAPSGGADPGRVSPVPAPRSGSAQLVLIVLGGVLGLWLAAMIVLAALHWTPR